MENIKRKKRHVRYTGIRRAPPIFKGASKLEPKGGVSRNELARRQLERLGSGSKVAEMHRCSVDSRGVQLSDRVVDLGRYRSAQPRTQNLNREKSFRDDQSPQSGVIDVRFARDNYVVSWEFPGVDSVEEMRRITREMFVDQAGDGPTARTIKYSALVRTCIVRSFWINRDINTILAMASQTQVPKRIMKLQRLDLWHQFNEVMIGTVDYMTDNPDHIWPLPLVKYLRLFQAGHLDRTAPDFKLF